MKLEHNKWYIVEIAFNDRNPIHRAVCRYRGDSYVELFGSYENIEYKAIKDLSYFNVVNEIVEMSNDDWLNNGKTVEIEMMKDKL